MKKLMFFVIEGGDGWDQPFKEHALLTPSQAMEAIEWSFIAKAHIELYYRRDGLPECPDIGFCFLEGVYEGHGLGPEEGETGWLADLADEAGAYINRPGKEMERFFQTLMASEVVNHETSF